jgi:hypothetical protein
MQYGAFNDADFKIYGVIDYTTNPDGSFKEYVETLRGLNIYK